jgi:hypothetical protein
MSVYTHSPAQEDWKIETPIEEKIKFLSLKKYAKVRRKLHLGISQPSIQWVQGNFPLGVKWQRCEADQSSPTSTEIKKTCTNRKVAGSIPDDVNFQKIYLILPAALRPGVYSASNRNQYQKHKN